MKTLEKNVNLIIRILVCHFFLTCISQAQNNDYDGDSVDDYGCYDAVGRYGQPPGSWYFMTSSNGFQTATFGYAGTVPVVGDYDGDGVDDYGCYDAAGNYGQPPGSWYFMTSSNGFQTATFGYAGTVPAGMAVMSVSEDDSVDDPFLEFLQKVSLTDRIVVYGFPYQGWVEIGTHTSSSKIDAIIRAMAKGVLPGWGGFAGHPGYKLEFYKGTNLLGLAGVYCSSSSDPNYFVLGECSSDETYYVSGGIPF